MMQNSKTDFPNNFKWESLLKRMASLFLAYVFWLPLGWLGIHRFYTGNIITGLIWMLSFGFFGIGWIVDFFLVPGLVSASNQRHQQKLFAKQNRQSGISGAAAQYVGKHAVKHVADKAITDFLNDR
tara:strand:+ start:137 stop:514 length:378 start_codon:yes stop_codon:yes gene_type:complete